MDELERKRFLDEIFRLRAQNAILQLQVVCLQQNVMDLMQRQQPQQQNKNHEVRQIQGGFREVLE